MFGESRLLGYLFYWIGTIYSLWSISYSVLNKNCHYSLTNTPSRWCCNGMCIKHISPVPSSITILKLQFVFSLLMSQQRRWMAINLQNIFWFSAFFIHFVFFLQFFLNVSAYTLSVHSLPTRFARISSSISSSPSMLVVISEFHCIFPMLPLLMYMHFSLTFSCSKLFTS